ncbi:MAG: hydantoinase/oxoprolinase N-terminal domain-containing protein, partial [Alphaproteobacteria bacterium]
DVGGTFSDLVVEDDAGRFHGFKAPTTPDDPAAGVLAAVVAVASNDDSESD